MKRLILLVLLLSFLLPGRAVAAEPSAASMILYEPRTGTVLRQRGADERRLIASTTKIMTALVVLEHSRLSRSVTITDAQSGIEGSSMGLLPGDSYTIEELLYGLMLASGNDAAIALAEHTAGSVEAFVEWMNEKAAALCLANTHFENPHGLDGEQHYSSARDLALLTAAAMENPDFCRLFAAREYQIHGLTFRNHNKLLEGYDGCIGGKTGYTRAAGRTLVSVAERDGLRLICVTLSDPNDWADHAALYDEAFSGYRFLTFPDEQWRAVPVISSTASAVPLQCDAPFALMRRDEETAVHVSLPRFVFAPVRCGDRLGTVRIVRSGKVIWKSDLLAAADAPVDPQQRLRPWERFAPFKDRYPTGAFAENLFSA